MKKLALITLALALTFTACSDSSGEPETNDGSDLIGKWRLDYFTPYTEDGETISIEECDKESIYEYTSNGEYKYEYVLNLENSECSVDGQRTTNYTVVGNTITNVDGDVTTIVTYTISNDELTITYEDGTIDRLLKTTDPYFSEL